MNDFSRRNLLIYYGLNIVFIVIIYLNYLYFQDLILRQFLPTLILGFLFFLVNAVFGFLFYYLREWLENGHASVRDVLSKRNLVPGIAFAVMLIYFSYVLVS